MNGRRYMLAAITIALLGAGLWPLINWRTDTARVLHRDYHRKYNKIDGNIVFLKVAWILDHPGRYDSFVLGSSRVRYGIPVDGLGDNWYKLEYPGANIGEHIHNLGLLLDRGVKVKHAILALDGFAIYGERDSANDYFYRLYPAGGLRDWLDFYRFYLFKKPRESEMRVLRGRRRLEPTSRFCGEREGKQLQERDTPGHAAAMLGLPPYDEEMTYVQQPHARKTLDEIRSLIALCERSRIRLDILITPLHYKTFYSRDCDAIAGFREALAAATPFWDFSGLTELHTNERYWHDTSHFTPDVGRLMLETVLGGAAVQAGFGARITPGNASAFYRDLHDEAVRALPGLMAMDPMVGPHDSFLGRTRPVQDEAIDVRRESVVVDLDRARSRGEADLLNLNVVCSDDGNLMIRGAADREAGPEIIRPLRKGLNRVFVPVDSASGRVEFKTDRPLMYRSTVKVRLCCFSPPQTSGPG